MAHIGHIGLQLDFVFCRLDNFVWLLNREVSDNLALLISNLNLSQNTVTYSAKYPNFITALYEVIIAFTHEVTIYGIKKEIIKNHEWIKRHSAILEHKDRYEHTIIK